MGGLEAFWAVLGASKASFGGTYSTSWKGSLGDLLDFDFGVVW